MSPQRKTLAQYGKRGDMVRVLVDKKRGRIEVKYRDIDGKPRKRTYPDTKEGRSESVAWGETYHSERAKIVAERKLPAKREPISVRDLWLRYTESPAFLSDLREKSRINYYQRWKKWEAFIKPDSLVDNSSLHDVDQFRMACEAAGISTNSVRVILNVVRIIYNWGQSRKLVTNNDLALFRWKTPKDAKIFTPGEFSTEQYEKMLRLFDPTEWRDWRPWVALMLLGESGQRFRAVAHLKRSDFDFENNQVKWAAEYQKQGKELLRPITHGMLSAFLVAEFWAEHELVKKESARIRITEGPQRGQFARDPEKPIERIDSPWMLFAMTNKTRPYSYQSFHYQLLKAEKEAGIEHEKYKAAHGFRRMVVGNIGEDTGDRMLGLEYVGDTDPKQLRSYDKRSDARMEKASQTIENKR